MFNLNSCLRKYQCYISIFGISTPWIIFWAAVVGVSLLAKFVSFLPCTGLGLLGYAYYVETWEDSKAELIFAYSCRMEKLYPMDLWLFHQMDYFPRCTVKVRSFSFGKLSAASAVSFLKLIFSFQWHHYSIKKSWLFWSIFHILSHMNNFVVQLIYFTALVYNFCACFLNLHVVLVCHWLIAT